MTKRVHDALRLDVASFAAEGATLAGRWPGGALDRLAGSQTPPQDVALEEVAWSTTGERRPVTGGEAELWLGLQADTRVWLTCQRCLQPFVEPLSVTNRIRFVRGESQAEALDAELEEDVLALSRSLDLRALVEDELLLALPLVPRHDTCPQPLPMVVEPDPASEVEAGTEPGPRAHPFAVLQALKRPGGDSGGDDGPGGNGGT